MNLSTWEFRFMVALMTPASLCAIATAIYFAPAVFALNQTNGYGIYALLVFMVTALTGVLGRALWERFHYVPVYKRARQEEWRRKKLEVKMGLRYPVTRLGRAWAHVHYVPMYKRQAKWAKAQARKNKV